MSFHTKDSIVALEKQQHTTKKNFYSKRKYLDYFFQRKFMKKKTKGGGEKVNQKKFNVEIAWNIPIAAASFSKQRERDLRIILGHASRSAIYILLLHRYDF